MANRTPAAPPRAVLTIRFKRASDGSAALTCVRADGSVTWQRQTGSVGAVLPHHDLTHVAVESALGMARGFYGLIAEGWEIADFAAPWPRGPVPAEAREAEVIVGLFDAERRMFADWSAADLREQGRVYVSAQRTGRVTVTLRELTDAEVSNVRAARVDLFARWSAVPPGGTLELEFPHSVPGAAKADY